MNQRNALLMICVALGLFAACNNATDRSKDTKNAPTATDATTKSEAGATTPTTTKNQPADTINPVIKPIQHIDLPIDTTKKYIYLTFDDGPHGGTKECMQVCRDLGIKATFFMVGRHGMSGKWEKQTVQDIRNSYPQFLLANHSYTHANEKYKYFYQHPDMATQDFYRAQDSLHVPFKIIRLPGNSAWVRNGELKSSHLVSAVCKELDSAGYNVIGWDVEWRFTRGKSFPVQTPTQMAHEVDYATTGHSHQKNHIMILTHDRMFRQPNFKDSLTKFIQLVQQHPNYVFETVDHYPNLKF